MMKKLFYVLIGLCAFCSCESTGYRISGYIPGAPDGAKVYLAPYDAFQDPNWDYQERTVCAEKHDTHG